MDNLHNLYEMTKDELEQLKGLVRDLLNCPAPMAGPRALAIIEELKKVVSHD